jgi:hypothetical protein
MPKVTYSHVLLDRPEGGTRVEFRVARPRLRDREAFLRLAALLEPMVHHGFAAIASLLEAEAAARRDGDDVAVPEGRGRFRSEPVTA